MTTKQPSYMSNKGNGNTISWPDGTEIDLGNSNGIQRKFIRDIIPGVVKETIVGLVISKQGVRSYPDKRNPGEFRYQLSFTIRDTATDFINVSCWGKDTFVLQLAALFKIGDIVEIRNSMAQTKQSPEIEERYRPWTSSQYQLVVSESHANVQLYSGWDFSEFSAFAYLPVREGNDYYTLGDVISNGQVLTSCFVNLLTVVKHVGETRDIMSKSGKKLKRKEIKLFDDTCYSFPLIIWEEELIEIAESWRPRDIVLFITDARISQDEYRKIMVATCTSKTIITVNPDTPEARHLYQYAQSAEIPIDETDDSVLNNSTIPDIAMIQDSYTIESLNQKLRKGLDASSKALYGFMYATITSFDIDSDSEERGIIRRRCSACRRRYDMTLQSCSNPMCLTANADLLGGGGKYYEEFDMRISLGDATGGIDNVIVPPDVLPKLLEHQVDEFKNLPNARKTQLKWKHLLERRKVYFKCASTRQGNQPIVIAFQLEVQ